MTSNPDISAMTIPDTIPTTHVVEIVRSSMDLFGTKDENVGKLVALGWVVDEETPLGTSMSHPLIPGTARILS